MNGVVRGGGGRERSFLPGVWPGHLGSCTVFTRARKPWVRISFGVPNVCFRTEFLPNSLKNWICGCSPGSQYRQLGGVTPNLGWMH